MYCFTRSCVPKSGPTIARRGPIDCPRSVPADSAKIRFGRYADCPCPGCSANRLILIYR